MRKIAAVVFGLAAYCLLLAPSTPAQNWLAAGSSAMWQTFGIAARVDNANGGTSSQGNCWTSSTAPPAGDNFHIWTGTNPTGQPDQRAIIRDLRGASGSTPVIPDVKGDIWIVWDDLNTVVCAYVNVDSSVGLRALFAFPQAQIIMQASAGAAGQQKIPSNLLNGATDDALSTFAYSAVNGQTINVAMADVRPEDGWYQTQRILNFGGTCTTSTSGTCLYVPTVGGAGQIQSGAYTSANNSTKTLSFANWIIPGGSTNSDPISGQTIGGPIFRQNTTVIGASPIVVFVNATNTGAYHLGNSGLTNINSYTLAGLLDGTLSRGEDLFAGQAASGYTTVPITTFQREVASGTYTTVEQSLARSRRVTSTQEQGAIPTNGCPSGRNINPPHNTSSPACPASWPATLSQQYGGTTGGSKKRAVGTADMVAAVNGTVDSLGYAFWSFGNFNADTNLKYLTLDGVDPIKTTYSGGALPQCTTPPCTSQGVSFAHLLDGTYGIWTELQMVTLLPTGNTATATALLSGSESVVVNKVPDYISYHNPTTPMGWFHAHSTASYIGLSPRNGHCLAGASGLQSGNMAGGAVYSIQADFDSCNDNGTELYENRD